MSRKTKTDWFIASIQILNDQGPQSLTIEALTKHLSVTKGSFYHHFGSLKQYKSALLAYFEEAGTLQIIAQAEEAATPQAKLQRLFEIVAAGVAESPTNIETGLRAWAQQDEEVRHLLRRVDARRIDYVKSAFLPILHDEDQAQLTAELFYTVLIGSEHTVPPLAQTRLRQYFTELLRLYGVYDE